MGGQSKKPQQELEAYEILKRKILALNRRMDGNSSQNSSDVAYGSGTPPGAPQLDAAEESETSEDEDDEVTYSMRMAPPRSDGTGPKCKRGLVKGNKTAMVVRRTGQKIKVDYNEATRFPSNKDTWSGLLRDLGAAIRDEVPMIKHSWTELDVSDKLKAFTPLSKIHYELEFDRYPGLFNLLDETANNAYKRWTATLHKRWKAMDAANTGNRDKPRLNHHAGSKPFSYYVEDNRKGGPRTPYINTFGDVYVRPGITEAQNQFENMQNLANKYTKDNLIPSVEPNTPIENLPALRAQVEIDIYGKIIGIRKGKEVRGLRRAIVRDLRHATILASQHTLEEQQNISELRAENIELKQRLEVNEVATQAIQDQLALFMTQMGVQQRFNSPVTPRRDDDPEGGNGNLQCGSIDRSVDITNM